MSIRTQLKEGFKRIVSDRRLLNNNKGIGFGDMLPIALSVVVLIFVVAASGVGLQAFRNSLTAASFADNITANGLSTLLNLTAQMPTVGTMLGVSLIIVVVIASFVIGRDKFGN